MENLKANLLKFVTLYAALSVSLIFTDYSKSLINSADLAFPCMIIYAILGYVYASTMMECMATKEKRTTYLMLPASSFEKYLSRLIYSLIIYSVAFLVAFKLADYTRILFMTSFSFKDQISPIAINSLWSRSDQNWSTFYFISQYLFFHSLFVLGGNIWYKKAFPKTIIALLVILLIYGKVLEWFLRLFYTPFNLKLNDWTTLDNLVIYISMGLMAMTLFNWTLAYFRFKEAEVINRII